MFDFSWITTPEGWIALLTLTLLEIVLGIDNIVFISILAGKLPPEERARGWKLGLLLALIPRILLLLFIPLVQALESVHVVSFSGHTVTGEGLVLLAGGLFLIAKSVHEIHDKLEGDEDEAAVAGAPRASFSSVIVQIMLLNVVFSLDSVITAIGLTEIVPIMIAAVLVSTGIMIVFAARVSGFVEKHPTVKVLALSFLILIGTNLVADGLGFYIPKGYTYFAMAFAVLVEVINLRIKRASKPLHLRHQSTFDAATVRGPVPPPLHP